MGKPKAVDTRKSERLISKKKAHHCRRCGKGFVRKAAFLQHIKVTKAGFKCSEGKLDSKRKGNVSNNSKAKLTKPPTGVVNNGTQNTAQPAAGPSAAVPMIAMKPTIFNFFKWMWPRTGQ